MLIIVNVVYVRGNIVTYIYIYRLHRDLIDVAMEFGWITRRRCHRCHGWEIPRMKRKLTGRKNTLPKNPNGCSVEKFIF